MAEILISRFIPVISICEFLDPAHIILARLLLGCEFSKPIVSFSFQEEMSSLHRCWRQSRPPLHQPALFAAKTSVLAEQAVDLSVPFSADIIDRE